jgi:hypothetical protein
MDVTGARSREASRGQRRHRPHERRAVLELATVEDAVQFASDVLRVLRIPDRVRLQCGAGYPAPGQPTAWERVLFNLLINAQAIRSGGH